MQGRLKKEYAQENSPVAERVFVFYNSFHHQSVFNDFKIVFSDTTERALEIVRQIFPLGSRSNSVVRIA